MTRTCRIRTSAGTAAIAVALALAVVVAGSPPAAAQVPDETDAAPAVGGAANVDDAVAGASDAHLRGAWTGVADWPLAAIHSILLPDGKVLTYGSDATGDTSVGLTYDVWDPAKGLGSGSHTTLPVRTSTNLFCAAQTVLPWNGQVMLTGGDEKGLPGGTEGDANDDVNIFDPAGQTMSRLGDSMAKPRWYPTTTTLPSGEILVHGGRDDTPEMRPITLPEVYHPSNGWRRLPGASSSDAYGNGGWWYPRSWVAPSGKIFMISKGNSGMWELDTSGKGSMTRVGTLPGPTTSYRVPAAMFDTGRILSISSDGSARVIDIRGASPQVRSTASLSSPRSWSDTTVLADGQVLVTGGASRDQSLPDARYEAEIWNPDTGRWRTGARAAKPRLYHSSSILLPDATVLTAGGGPPGPVANLNAEIYQPPYLFKSDGSGDPAARPRISSMGTIRHGRQFTIDLGGDGTISKVALVRTGSNTHSFDMDQRWQELSFTQSGSRLTVTGPRNTRTAPPGQYMVFVINAAGTPSVAKIQRIASAVAPTSTGVQAGSLTLTSQASTGRWIDATFPRPFASTPVVTAGPLSSAGRDPSVARVRNVTRTGFQVRIDEWDRIDGDHGFETLSWLAATPGRHTLGDITLEAGAVTASDAPRRIEYRQRFGTTPVVLTQVAGVANSQPVITRLSRSFRGGSQVQLQERESRIKAGATHGNETVHWMALSGTTGRVDGRALRIGKTALNTTHRWNKVWLKGRYPDGGFLASPQTTTGIDPAALRYRRLWARSVEIRMQEDRTHDRETNHSAERIGWVAFGAR